MMRRLFSHLNEHSLTLRLTAVTAAALIVFSLMVSVLYNLLMREATISHYSRILQRDAYAISQNLHDLFSPGTDNSIDDTRLEIGWDTLAPYLAMTEQITRCNVYLVDARHRVTGYFEGVVQTLDHVMLSAYLEQSIALGFMGKNPFLRSNTDGDTRLTTSAPIMDENSRVLGVVLLDVSLRELGYTQVSGTAMIGVSALVSFILALLLAFILSAAFTRPIHRTRRAALKLAQGEYETRLPVRGSDEVGQLASSVNILAERLEAARRRDEELHKRQQRFFSTVSHELRTPVTVIRGSAELLSEEILNTPESRTAAARQILKESEWLQKLIADLLELSRLQDPDFAIEKKPVNLSELLGDAAMSAGTLCKRRGVVMVCEEPTRTYTVTGDYQRLRQMLMAVIDNAVKFTPEGKRMTLSLSQDAPSIIISDEGRGIPESELPHIFDRFYHTNRLNSEGTGLGLPLVHEIARRHEIDIAVRSEPDKGTTFTFTFMKAD